MEPNFLEEIVNFNAYNDYVDIPLIILYVLVGYYLKYNFRKTWKWPMDMKVILVGTIMVAIYIALLFYTEAREVSAWPKMLYSWIAAAALFEMILNRFSRKDNEKKISVRDRDNDGDDGL